MNTKDGDKPMVLFANRIADTLYLRSLKLWNARSQKHRNRQVYGIWRWRLWVARRAIWFAGWVVRSPIVMSREPSLDGLENKAQNK